MPEFALLHVVQIVFLSKAKRIEPIVARVATVQLGWTLKEWKGDGVIKTVISTTIFRDEEGWLE
jgi:hypothetical protein